MKYLFFLLSFSALASEPMPESLRRYAESYRPEVVRLLLGDPELAKECFGGKTPPENEVTLALGKADLVYQVDPSRVASAEDIDETLVSTGEYAVPLCQGERCGAVASFRLGKEGPEFLSAGYANGFRRRSEGRKKLLAKGETDLRVVRYPDVHGEFFRTPARNDRPALLWTYDGRAMTLADLQKIAAHAEEHADLEPHRRHTPEEYRPPVEEEPPAELPTVPTIKPRVDTAVPPTPLEAPPAEESRVPLLPITLLVLGVALAGLRFVRR